MNFSLTEAQQKIINAPIERKIFLSGQASAGKTTVGVHRLRHLIDSGIYPHSILVLVPQQRLAQPYYDEIRHPNREAGAEVTVATLGSLSHQIVNLFWPLALDQLNPNSSKLPPTFLSQELIQYIMFKVVEPEIVRHDYFNSVKIERTRLFSQITDNLNKASIIGFPPTEFGHRLKTAMPDDLERINIFENTQACANLFRQYCLEHRLLDFSLQVTLFMDHLWKMEIPRTYLTNRFTHLIVDNTEEDSPATHRLLSDWLQTCESGLLIYDDLAGYRRFLGADEQSALLLRENCDDEMTLEKSCVMTPPVAALLGEISEILAGADKTEVEVSPHAAIAYTPSEQSRFHTQMLDWMADCVVDLVREQGESQSNIVILAPLLSDSLRFAIVSRLESRGIAAYSLRPSRPLHDEPAIRALITLAKLAHPDWIIDKKHEVRKFDVVQMLISVIGEMDLARANLLTEMLFKAKTPELLHFNGVTNAEIRSRISEVLGARFEKLVAWMDEYKAGLVQPVDVFFSRLFGQVLSQKGFGFYLTEDSNFDEARLISNLIESAKSFRQTLTRIEPEQDSGQEYIKMVDAGVLANQYEPQEWKENPDAVLIAPAYTFLLSNQAVDFQFWLNIDSPAWNRRLQQPLTQPYVLSLQWPADQIWTEQDELRTSREMLYKVISGLLKRCRKKIFVGHSKFDERGQEREGELRGVFDLLMRSMEVKE